MSSSLNDPENFRGRVNYAAAVISNLRNSTRSFDNCFENNDGDVVAAALMRRAERNPKLKANIPRYLNMDMAEAAFAEYRNADLPAAARKIRTRSAWATYLFFNKGLSLNDLATMAGIADLAKFMHSYPDNDDGIGAAMADLRSTIARMKSECGEAPPAPSAASK
ncbi:hypothetical protein GCM10019059_40930 [Camelimonas fluminis]|uniref:Uncharacterized protein n=1 Tax=Camelimonas fluminis TaxID=1576911 RepID=A0ABV7UCD2_9HYPH|nr:hypothetical protein [Camelimonas fluminis]GHE77755.1 hypothetical protein GCM10019059_40930 [Camelimonas fluminis]